jgi:hypothetical protein
MMQKYNLENYYQLSILKVVYKILQDLNKIEGFELLEPKPWKSNLPNILPFIGNVMEEEIKFKIKGYEILAHDQKLRNQK